MSLVDLSQAVLTLRGIDPANLYKLYNTGNVHEFRSVRIQVADMSTIQTSFGLGDNDGETFKLKDRINLIEKVVVIGTRKCRRCFHCLQDFDNEPMGIPIAITEENKQRTYHTDASFHCGIRCAYARLLRELGQPLYCRDVKYINSKSQIMKLNDDLYPGTVLIPAKPFQLLESNGGHLTLERYWGDEEVFDKTPNIHIIPARVYYSNGSLSVPT